MGVPNVRYIVADGIGADRPKPLEAELVQERDGVRLEVDGYNVLMLTPRGLMLYGSLSPELFATDGPHDKIRILDCV